MEAFEVEMMEGGDFEMNGFGGEGGLECGNLIADVNKSAVHPFTVCEPHFHEGLGGLVEGRGLLSHLQREHTLPRQAGFPATVLTHSDG